MTMVPTGFRAETAFADLGEAFSDVVAPADFPKAIVRVRNQRWAEQVGLGDLGEDDWVRHFARFEPLPGAQAHPLAMRYHGHQFQTYNPQIGDGRGFLFAQMRDAHGRLLDFGTKGSGQTPYSRFGDGRLTLKGGVREALATVWLEAHGVYTSKTFSLIETGEQLSRNDEPSPTRSSVLVRLQHSHVRFGTFQRHAYHQRGDLLEALVDHCITCYHTGLLGLEGEARVAGLVEAIAQESARLCASWMAAGFVHGVLNTDNMNVTGESFDYGPWRVLPTADANFTAAYFDHGGLYAYGRQPQAVFWNLKQLAGALSLICDAEALTQAVAVYPAAFAREQRRLTLRRLGLAPRSEPDDIALLNAMYSFIARADLSWEGFLHDWFCGQASASRALHGPRAAAYASPAFTDFARLLDAYEPEAPERLAHPYFAAPEPASLVIGEVEAVWDPIAGADDWSAFAAKLAHIETARLALGLDVGARP